MKKKLILILMVLALLLAGCGKEPEPTVPPTTEPPTEPPMIDIGGTELEPDTTALDLATMTYDFDTLLAKAEELPDVAQIELGTTDLTMEQIEAIQLAFENAQVNYTVELFGEVLTPDIAALDMSAMDVSCTDELVNALSKLPAVAQINFVSGDGICAYDLESIGELDKVRAAVPGAYLRVKFDLFGQTVTSEDERIEYYCVPIGNDGAETVRAVLPYLTSCTYFLLDGCEIDNEVLDQMRSDFPETKIVWRVWLAGPYYKSEEMMKRCSFLTDTHIIRTVVVSDKNCHVLKYCIETKYVDFGHNDYISDCSFLAYMPDLEVAILALTKIEDISALANCPKLEYLELFESEVRDLSPLANLTNLEHLNIATLPNLSDISPLYGLTNLKRLRMIKLPKVSDEQVEEFARLVPDCAILNAGWDETGNGWRKDENGEYVPRYALLREQMEYGKW